MTAARDRVHIAPGSAILTDSARFQRLAATAHEQTAQQRIDTLFGALAIVDRGTYLPGITSAWAEERRSLLLRSVGDVRIELGEALFHHGRYPEARHLLGTALEEEPYSERAWRLEMLLANAVGDDDGVLNALRGCRARLKELGLQPSPHTIELAERLRA